MNRFFSASVALAVALLAGCASVVTPASHVPATVPPGAAAADAGIALGTPAREWWRALGDPVLDALVAESGARNHDLRAAMAAVGSARALADATARDALPQGRLDAQAQALRPSAAEADPYRQGLPRPPASRLVTVAPGLAWEIDLFGRVGTAAAVADRRADAAAADLHGATALLQAEVVRHYTGLRLRQQTLQALAAEADAHAARVQQLRTRAEAGLADRREALAAEAEQARVQTERAQAEAARQTHLAALAVLAGRSPADRGPWSAALQTLAALPAPPADDAIVQPSDLLARRPDVARADAQLRAAIGETVLAERAHLPRISLNLALALNAPLSQLGSAGALRYAAGPALTWDWLDAGRLKARAAAARAGQEAALHSFEQTVLRALQDSEVALRQWAAARAALAEARRAEALAAQAAAHAQSRVAAGLEPPEGALAAVAAQQRARCAALSAQADALTAFGQVQLALGAWQPQRAATDDSSR